MDSSDWRLRAAEAGVRLDRDDQHLRVHSVNVFVRDLDRSLDFYVRQLGFLRVLDRRLHSGRRVVAVAPPDGATMLRLVVPEHDAEAQKLIGRPTQVTFLTEDVVAKFREWLARGVRFRSTPRLKRVRYEGPRLIDAPAGNGSQQPPVWGGVFARFEDIDGNSFTLAGYDEASWELDRHRRAVAEKLEAERRASQELEIARQVQARLFPQRMPGAGPLEYAGACIQARQVGGDYYDFLNLGEDRLGLVIGDIAGKGIAAALLMANLQANLRSQCATALAQPQRFLESVNRLFYENTSDSAYATLFFAEYDARTNLLRYANCGHLAALVLRRDDALDRLGSTSTVLGLFRDWTCCVSECRLASGDTLALYTDGVTEAFNDRDEEFGEERLIAALRRNRRLAPDELLEAILDEVRCFSPREQHDDLTLIVARTR